MIAILTNTPERALKVLQAEGVVETYNPASRRGTFLSRREFKIVDQVHQLENVVVVDYRKIGNVSDELIEAARVRMR